MRCKKCNMQMLYWGETKSGKKYYFCENCREVFDFGGENFKNVKPDILY